MVKVTPVLNPRQAVFMKALAQSRFIARLIYLLSCGEKVRMLCTPSPPIRLAKRSECSSHLLCEKLRLFPRREVTALGDFMEVVQRRIGLP